MFRAAAAWVGPAPGSLYVSELPLTCYPRTLALTLSRSRPGHGVDTNSGHAPPCCGRPPPSLAWAVLLSPFPQGVLGARHTHPHPLKTGKAGAAGPQKDWQGALASRPTSPEHLWFSGLTCREFLTSDYRLSCYAFIRLVFILFFALKASG